MAHWTTCHSMSNQSGFSPSRALTTPNKERDRLRGVRRLKESIRLATPGGEIQDFPRQGRDIGAAWPVRGLRGFDPIYFFAGCVVAPDLPPRQRVVGGKSAS
jgi:hypothetical protein